MDRTKAVVSLVQAGFRVIPIHTIVGGRCTCEASDCQSLAKHPIPINGSTGITDDAEQVAEWWGQTNGIANVAIATGDSLMVIDCDGAKGKQDLRDLEAKHGELPITVTAETPGGGEHLYFRSPTEIRNTTKLSGLSIDVRGTGGYVIAPPSDHANGGRYAWRNDPAYGVADAPAWLLELVGGTTAGVHVGEDLDLRTAAGVAKGERNSRCTQLVGAHFQRGEDPDVILRLALTWGESCTPALPAGEVKRIVASIEKREASSVACDPVETIPLPSAVPWPTLDPAALHGIAGDFIRAIEPHTEADPVGMLVQLLVAFGNLVGREPRFLVESDLHHSNLFCVCVGESSRGRKGVSRGRVLDVLKWADGEWGQACIQSGLSSGEGLIWAVRDEISKNEPVKERRMVVRYQNVVTDPGVSDKRLLVCESEFGQTLRVMRRETNTLSPVIRAAWDSGDLKTLVKNNPAKATGAHISIIGHITRHELTRYLSESDLFSGFANRFLWVVVRRSRLLPDGGEAFDLNPLRQRVATVVNQAKGIERMRRSPEANERWREIYHSFDASRGPTYAAITNRSEAQTLRLAMIYALLDGSETIEVPHLEAAYAVWQYADASVRLIFGAEEIDDPLCRTLLRAIRKQPGITRTQLHAVTNRHVEGKVLVEALAKLRDAGLAYPQVKPTQGRPAEKWFPKGTGLLSELAKKGPEGNSKTIDSIDL